MFAGHALIGKQIGSNANPLSWWNQVNGPVRNLGFYAPYLPSQGSAPLPNEIVTRNDNSGGMITNIEAFQILWD